MKLYVEPCPACGQREQWVQFNLNCATERRVQCACGLCAPWAGQKESPWAVWNHLAIQCEVGRDAQEASQ